MRAIQKYKGSKNPEHQRRIAQSFGYRISIADMPHLVNLCAKAGILFDHLQYTAPVMESKSSNTAFVDEIKIA